MPDFDSIEDASAVKPPAVAPQSFDDIKDVAPKSFDDIEEAAQHIPIDNSKAFVEGMGRNMTFGATDALQHGVRKAAESLGSQDPNFWAPSDKDVAERKESLAGKAGEAAGIIGGLTTGAGTPGFIQGFAREAAPQAISAFGKIGSAAITSAIESGAIQAGDEISKAMLGQGDPKAPVASALANIGAAGLFSAGTGAGFSALGQAGTKGLAALENEKMGTQATNILAGMGMAAKAHGEGIPEKEVESYIAKQFTGFAPEDMPSYKDLKPGVKAYYSGVNNAINAAVDKTVGLTAGAVGNKIGGAPGAMIAYHLGDKAIAPVVENILQKPLMYGTNKIAIPTIMYALSKGQTTGLFNALDHATQAAKGFKAIGKGVDAVLKAGSNQVLDFAASDKDKKKIIDYIDNGGIEKEMQDSLQEQQPQETPGFAQGGQVQPHDNGSIASLYPAQDMMMSAAKGRISNYLSSLKPQPNPSKLPFDRDPNREIAESNYHDAIHIAAAPLSILKRIKDGTVQASQIKDFNMMYPELHEYLSQKFTEGIMNQQLDEEKLPYKTRQALSLFMGTALDSTMQQPSIMAAQSVFTPKKPPMQPQEKPNKKSKSAQGKLGKDVKSYKTADQAAESDRSDRD